MTRWDGTERRKRRPWMIQPGVFVLIVFVVLGVIATSVTLGFRESRQADRRVEAESQARAEAVCLAVNDARALMRSVLNAATFSPEQTPRQERKASKALERFLERVGPSSIEPLSCEQLAENPDDIERQLRRDEPTRPSGERDREALALLRWLPPPK